MARLFEKWLDAGGDSTFSEWLATRREHVEQIRFQRKMSLGLFSTLAAQQQANRYAQLQAAAMQNAYAPPYRRGPGRGVLGGLGGIFG